MKIKDEIDNLDTCASELIFDIFYPLEPINSHRYPDLYHHYSGWLTAYPINVFHRHSNVDLKKAKLKKESKEARATKK